MAVVEVLSVISVFDPADQSGRVFIHPLSLSSFQATAEM
jgi:hypothetical protein